MHRTHTAMSVLVQCFLPYNLGQCFCGVLTNEDGLPRLGFGILADLQTVSSEVSEIFSRFAGVHIVDCELSWTCELRSVSQLRHSD